LPQSIVRNAKRTAEMIESEYDVEELERKLKKARKHLEDQRK
jgi:F0F1-type ATP synthase membrane subunit b/b'